MMTGGPLKVLSQSWLVHAMTRGDVGRIMEPLFLTLLDPCTARVSVLHCSLGTIHKLRKQSSFCALVKFVGVGAVKNSINSQVRCECGK